jgi:hypothetical protein
VIRRLRYADYVNSDRITKLYDQLNRLLDILEDFTKRPR